jgi:hypothetical protein
MYYCDTTGHSFIKVTPEEDGKLIFPRNGCEPQEWIQTLTAQRMRELSSIYLDARDPLTNNNLKGLFNILEKENLVVKPTPQTIALKHVYDTSMRIKQLLESEDSNIITRIPEYRAENTNITLMVCPERYTESFRAHKGVLSGSIIIIDPVTVYSFVDTPDFVFWAHEIPPTKELCQKWKGSLWAHLNNDGGNADLENRGVNIITGPGTPVQNLVWQFQQQQTRKKYVLSPRLNPEQISAIQTLVSRGWGVLVGPGGSGKSEVIKYLPGPLLVLITTCVAKNMLKTRMKNKVVDVCTVERWCTIIRHGGTKKREIVKKVRSLQTLVIDEMTLVTPEQLFCLFKYFRSLNPFIRIIMVGDTKQLCHQGIGTIFKEILLHFPHRCSHLTHIHRQKDNDTLLVRVLKELREASSVPNHTYKRDHTFAVDLFSHGWEKTVFNKWKACREEGNVDVFRVIASTNKDVEYLNAIANSALGPVNCCPDDTMYFFVGQKVVVGSGDALIDGGTQLVIVSISDNNSTTNYVMNAPLKSMSKVSMVLVDGLGNRYKVLLSRAKYMLKPAYTTTIQKMQGSEVNHIWYVPSKTRFSPLNLDARGNLYTAASRAKLSFRVCLLGGYSSSEDYVNYLFRNHMKRNGIWELNLRQK